jgi:hypothetical protein
MTTTLWEDQDDGLEDDVQLAAVFHAISRCCDLLGEDAKVSAYFWDKYKNIYKELKRRYNSAKYRDINIKEWSF